MNSLSRRRMTTGLLALGMVYSLAGCQAIPKEAKIELAKPVDCSTAPQDIALLEKVSARSPSLIEI